VSILPLARIQGGNLNTLAGNATFGWWWLDPLIGLAVAAVAVREGSEARRGLQLRPGSRSVTAHRLTQGRRRPARVCQVALTPLIRPANGQL
jgi:hypothetical protein